MENFDGALSLVLAAAFIAAQLLYFGSFLIEIYLFTLPVNRVDMSEERLPGPGDYPFIVTFYPVLRELEATMRTTLLALSQFDYPKDRYVVIAIPNANDEPTVESLKRLQSEFSCLRLLPVPPTSDPSWQPVWDDWENNPKAYWFHQGARAGVRDLPAKKTRQLIYAFYNIALERKDKGEFFVNYIDADSAPPRDHFKAAAIGMKQFDVVQATNVAGNLNDSLAASWFAFDHMVWDGMKYGHLTADGRQPYFVLGKGQFFKASDLRALGGFHPWLAIEDPEVGVRFWANGKKLGLIDAPLVEEVPVTFINGITQRKRWMCGFFQTLDTPLKALGMSPWQRTKVWLNFLPCLAMWINSIGLPIGVWALIVWWNGTSPLPYWTAYLSAFNVLAFATLMTALYINAWKRTAFVLSSTRERLWYMFRVNPVFLMIHWLVWLIPLWLGWRMYRADGGLTWVPTEKIDANAALVRLRLSMGT